MNETIRQLKNKLAGVIEEEDIITDADMREYTSFKAGGRADLLLLPKDVNVLKAVLKLFADEGTEFMVMGNGTDILIKDGGYRGVIVKMGDAFAGIEANGNEIICGGGALLAAVSRRALAEGLTGMEFASGIPGSVGGAVFMNAGAYGGEMKDILDHVDVISGSGEERTISCEDLSLGYRQSVIQETGETVLRVVIRLEHGDKEEISARMKELGERRNEKQPVNYPSAGSFFKRPEGYFAGKLIQDSGLKGLSVGGAKVSELHSGFIINTGGATASDIVELMHLVQAKVMEDAGVMLEPEVRIIGED